MNFCSFLLTSSKRQDTTKPTQKQINAVSTSICYLRDGRVPIDGRAFGVMMKLSR